MSSLVLVGGAPGAGAELLGELVRLHPQGDTVPDAQLPFMAER
jgi:hypothetical protein